MPLGLRPLTSQVFAVTPDEMAASEAAAMAQGWTEEQLLDTAGRNLGHAIARFYPNCGTAIGFLGKGHNAADTLIALQVLRDHYNWKIDVENVFPILDFAPLARKKWDELGSSEPSDHSAAILDTPMPILLLDGLLGSGGKGPLSAPLLAAAHRMATLRSEKGAYVASIDLPSGVDPLTGEAQKDAVVADVTFMLGNAKVGLLTAIAANHTGALALVPVAPLTRNGSSTLWAITPQTSSFAKAPRPFDFHKGMAGRVGIYAGSRAYPGAAALAATGALRGGAGLVTLFVPPAWVSDISGKCPPEIIIRGLENPLDLLCGNFDALVIGCGVSELDKLAEDRILELIAKSNAPIVIDAEALNLIARRKAISILDARHVLTPHPGEFARLAPDLTALPREIAAQRFSVRHPCTLLLKGCRTLISHSGQSLFCNTTGTPGMASGGQGDLLAGVIGARLAAKDILPHAAALGAWLCGRAAEIALTYCFHSEESLTASDVSSQLGAAYRDWQTACR